ncbi:Eukaryotic translation initiation factor 4E transporter, partial [Eschrichtius robustus]|nr:Eukaryotic translation initiation factor 4E transporter [Eschrichtius robustus]
EELLDIKERPHSKQRPSCLSEKYDSDGVWDPEKWHASLYPASGRSSPMESLKKELDTDRPSLVRRIVGLSLKWITELDVGTLKLRWRAGYAQSQRRSFGGGCHVTAAVSSRRSGSPLEKDSDGLRLLGGRRIGSGRIISARTFEKDHRLSDKDLRDLRDRDRERDYKDKRFRREFVDSKRVFERRRNDSYTEEEPEWFSAGPTSQSETIELTGFDDKILEEDHKGRKRTRRRTASVKEGILLAKPKKPELMCEGYLVKGGGPLVVFRAVTRLVVLGGSREEAVALGPQKAQGSEAAGTSVEGQCCLTHTAQRRRALLAHLGLKFLPPASIETLGVAEEDEVEVILEQEPAADQEVPRDAVLPEQSPGEFDFNEFFNLDKVPCLASKTDGNLIVKSFHSKRSKFRGLYLAPNVSTCETYLCT